MKFIVKENYEEVCKEAFKIMKEVVDKGNSTLGLATGSTPIGLYNLLVEDHKTNHTSYKNIKTFNLDEYVGIAKSHYESYDSFMKRNLFSHIDINMDNVNLPRGYAEDLEQECKRYNELLENNTVDIQLLGIGANGHIGFNEPGTPFDSVTYITNLTEKTIKDNSRFFDSISEVPTKAITMGIKNILQAKKILLLATGKNKAEAIKRLHDNVITEDLPASALHMHKDVIVIVDKDAYSLV